MTRFCSACGTPLGDETARFCAKCGTAVAAPPTSHIAVTPKGETTMKTFWGTLGAILCSIVVLYIVFKVYVSYKTYEYSSEQEAIHQQDEKHQRLVDNFQNCSRLISDKELQGLHSATYPENDPRGIEDKQLVEKVEKIKNDDFQWIQEHFPNGTMSDKDYAACQAREDSETLR